MKFRAALFLRAESETERLAALLQTHRLKSPSVGEIQTQSCKWLKSGWEKLGAPTFCSVGIKHIA